MLKRDLTASANIMDVLAAISSLEIATPIAGTCGLGEEQEFSSITATRATLLPP
jgi:hypothetical protein